MPLLPRHDAMYYWMVHAGWEYSQNKIKMVLNNLHYEESSLGTLNVNYEKWLDRDELADWVQPEVPKEYTFTDEDIRFRKK